LKTFTKISALIVLLNTAFVFSQAFTWQPLGEASSNNNGTNGNVYAVTSYNGKIIVGGLFTQAGGPGGVSASNIAEFDPVTSTWSSLGSGINGEVHALTVRGGELIAGGLFTTAGGSSANNVARWNGTTWQSLGTGNGTNGEVDALIVFGGDLIAGGEFSNAGGVGAQNIARWNGSAWFTLAAGFDDNVHGLTIFQGNLVAGGRFDNSGSTPISKVARWNGTTWSSFNSDQFDDRVFAVGVYNNELYVGGRFENVGSLNAANIVKWTGSAWAGVGGGVDREVEAFEVYKGSLIVAGNFRVAGNSLFVDRIASWNGSSWSRMLTGMNDRVNGLYTFNSTDTVLYAVGEFSSAGGKWSSHTAKWGSFTTSSVSGTVKFADDGSNVTSGKVKIVRYDVVTREVIAVDSADVVNGTYSLPRVPRFDQDLRVIVFPDDELDGGADPYVPTYHPSTLEWLNAQVVIPINNQTNINIGVIRKGSLLQNTPAAANISGYVYLNILPPANNLIVGFPYLNSSVLYLKKDTSIVQYAFSNDLQEYSLTGLSAGTYTLSVVRLGYESETRTIVLGATNLDTVNFYLDTLNPIGITSINTTVPKGYSLEQNYPNPFNPVTNIRIKMPKEGFVKLIVYDVTGREAAILVNETLRAGEYNVDFNAGSLPSGVYFYRLLTKDFSETKKMVLVK